MNPRIIIRYPKIKGTPEWIFSWREKYQSWPDSFLAIVIVSLLFFIAMMSMQVRVTTPRPAVSQQAALILLDYRDPRSILARERGPFPTRFDPLTWHGSRGMEMIVNDATRAVPKKFLPALLDLPGQRTALFKFEEYFSPIFPENQPAPIAERARKSAQVVAEIFVLGGDAKWDHPEHAKLLEGSSQPSEATGDWRFMVEISAAGQVLQAFMLYPASHPASPMITRWLSQQRFEVRAGESRHWAVLNIMIRNQYDDAVINK